jgi:outer membrane protein OmpA-like peptidoglycan-associated protein
MLSAQPPQAANPTQQPAFQADGGTPVYRITVVARTTKAINYHHRSGSTQIGFRGTALMPEARGEAKVESKQGVIKIDADMNRMQPATSFGPEYLTYVMWAITPEGRATNVGEVLLNGGKSKLNATSELQSFGLIITAEPYFAVTQPSDVVVMENFVTDATRGTIEDVDAKYELLQRGQYILNVKESDRMLKLDPKTPLELYEARNAVRIARWTGAERYAADTYAKAVIGLENAEGYLIGKGGKKPIGTVAREAVQMAEDARIITLKKMQEEGLTTERASAANREAFAKTETAIEKERRLRAETASMSAQSETDRVKRESDAAQAGAQAEARRLKRENENERSAAQVEADRLKSEADRLKAENEAQRVASLTDSDRMRREAENQRLSAKADMDRAAKDKADAEAARAEAVTQQKLAQAETEKARLATAEANGLRMKAETDRADLRKQLLAQFNLILETRDTARGLIVNMSDVLFDSGKYTLRAGAREKLAKVSGIFSGHPGLKLEVEGHTDSVGGDEMNQTLSENRATSVREYLVKEGVTSGNITSNGFGKTQPVVSNDTAAGRQQNRRVELVVSGEIIGTRIGIPIAKK